MFVTPAVLYNSAGLPLGSRAVVNFYRPTYAADTTGIYPAGYTAPNVANVISFGNVGNGTLLGSYIIEDLSLELAGAPMGRTGIFSEDSGDPSLVRKDPKLSLTAQMAGAGTPTLCPGDYCQISVGMTAASTTAAPAQVPASRWFVDSDSVQGSQVNKFGLKLSLDRVNSDPTLSQF